MSVGSIPAQNVVFMRLSDGVKPRRLPSQICSGELLSHALSCKKPYGPPLPVEAGMYGA
jgi:hypothetical protein